MSKLDRKALLLDGPVGKGLMTMQIPMMIGIGSVILFSVVDTIYVGILGQAQLAAVAFTFPVGFLFHSLGIGLGVGTSAIIARAIGSGDEGVIRRLTTDSLRLTFLLISIMALVALLIIDPLYTAMNADADTLVLIKQYIIIWYACVPLLVVPMVANSAIRATGDTKTPMYIMLTAGLVNIVLDPLLIFGIGPFPRMELSGAAIATAIAWGCTSIGAMGFLAKRLQILDFGRRTWGDLKDSWRRNLFISLPALASNMSIPFAGMIVTGFVALHGEAAVAAFGVGTRVESLVMVGCYAMSAALTPFIGQNHGAGNMQRVHDGAAFASRFALKWGLGVCIVLALFAVPIAKLFTKKEDLEVAYLAARFLWIVPISYAGYGLIMQVSAVFNAVNRPLRSASIVFIRLFIFVVPLAYVGGQWGGVLGIFGGAAIGNICGGLVARLFLLRGLATVAPLKTDV